MKTSVRGLLGTLSLATLTLAGCRGGDNVSYSAISSNLTPELQTLHERPIDVDRNLAVNNNQNLRLFWDDLGRFFYTDTPSRLGPHRAIRTSGNAR